MTASSTIVPSDHSTEKEYFLTNLPWLIGSLGTMVEDAVIFFQFRIYILRRSPRDEAPG
jgi:hypothetical protein